MRPSKVREVWASGRPVLATVAQFTDPCSAELISMLGFDCIWMDFEHQTTSLETASNMFRAARVGGADVMARPGKGEYSRIMRLLEAGANGILYPRCESADEAREVVRWAKFAPKGERGYFGSNPDGGYGTLDTAPYVRNANEQNWILAQIESPNAVEHARAIAEVDGIDGTFFGPGDYSLLAGVPGQVMSDVVMRAVERTCRETLAAGKRFATLCFNVEHTRRVLDMGGSFIGYGSDLNSVAQGLRKIQAEMTPLGFKFDPRFGAGASAYAPTGEKAQR